MVEKKIIADAVELVKNIPSTDEKALEKFDSTEGTDVLVPLQEQDTDIPPYPVAEYEVIVESSLYKFNRKVNDMLSQGWDALGGVNVVQTSTGIKFYQAMERWNVDSEEEPEMPSENSEADTMGPKPLYIPGLEDEPDLYEDFAKDEPER